MSKAKITAPASLAPALRLQHKRMLVKADLIRVARECGLPEGEAPSCLQYQTRGRFGTHSVLRVAGEPRQRWAKAMPVYGLRSYRTQRLTDRSAVVADLRRVAAMLGDPDRMPSSTEYDRLGTFSHSTIAHVLADGGSWFAAGVSAGLRTPESRRMRYRPPHYYLDLYREAATRMGYKRGGYGPSASEWRKQTGYCPHSMFNKRKLWTSWREFVEAAGYRCRPSGGACFKGLPSRRAA